VQLPGEAVEVRANSNLVANLSAAYRNWSLLGTVQWDPEIDEIARSTVGLSYRAGPTRVANLTQRLRRDDSGLTELDQIGFSVAWPLGRHWTGFGQADYSLLDDRELETLFGLEYASCCYAVRAVARRYVTPDEDTYNDTFFVQFVLKGLGNLGQGADSLLEREILGYDAIY
jgi:LPS-assembly protein